MSLYKNAEKALKEKYDIDILEQIVLARNDRAVYFVEFHNGKIDFTKIHGKSPMDLLNDLDFFTFDILDDIFFMNSKYGEVAGKEYYKKNNLDSIKYMDSEANVTIPLTIKNQLFWVRLHLYKTLEDELGNISVASCYITDVSKYLVHEESLYEKTHKDELTHLFNRYALYYHFELHGSRTPITSFFFDIDDFKVFNDSYGHDVGDEVLVRLSNKLTDLTDTHFSAYRLGGDEFYCLLFDKTLDEAKEYVSKLQESMKSIRIKGVKESLTLSIGVVHTTDDITHKREVFMKEADRLMYISKKNGKNTVTYGDFIVYK